MGVAGIELGIVFFFEAKVPRNNLLSRKDAKLAILTAVREATGYLWWQKLAALWNPGSHRKRQENLVAGVRLPVEMIQTMEGDPRVSKPRLPKAYTDEQLVFLRSHINGFETRTRGHVRGDAKKFALDRASEFLVRFGLPPDLQGVDEAEPRFREVGASVSRLRPLTLPSANIQLVQEYRRAREAEARGSHAAQEALRQRCASCPARLAGAHRLRQRRPRRAASRGVQPSRRPLPRPLMHPPVQVRTRTHARTRMSPNSSHSHSNPSQAHPASSSSSPFKRPCPSRCRSPRRPRRSRSI